ncbi:MAG: FAD-binding oxidoreductase [Ferruginibacter sp.]|nr:FAD-binding oxidoreductase [Ferruginibacter sp.]
MLTQLELLAIKLDGALYYNQSPLHQTQLLAYSTDASVYQEKPLAVAIPENITDIQQLVEFARLQQVTLIPRAAGTSLAGQVVGDGIVVDISKYFNKIIEVNAAEKWVKVQPGVIRDDLNKYLLTYGLMFGPETSTANRAMMGGMVGNNSCGLHSIVWGAVRENLLEVAAIMSDGETGVFKNEPIDYNGYSGIKQEIYKGLYHLLEDESNQQLIRQHFPKASVVRRNSGYALDSLLQMQPFSPSGEPFNLCKLIAGSEGTLAFITEIKLQLIDLPPKEIALVCVHCHSIDDALRANIIALQHSPMASELVDRYIMNFTKAHPEYHKNCFFIEGDPAAVLMVEFMEHTKEAASLRALSLVNALETSGYGYAFPVLYNAETKYAWDVRKAGLGLLRNLPGDIQPVNLIEDCAVAPEELPAYIKDLQVILNKYKVNAAYYAHAGAGELHVEPMINLKTAEGVETFRNILSETVELVKKYNGSLSGEHGDGRLRGEYISTVVGKGTYQLFKDVKQLFDPQGIFNKGKITGTPPMDQHLRVNIGNRPAKLKTNFDFSGQESMLRLAEKCSGSGDCRKSEITGGVMCPSYMATRNEKDTTRARANILRQFLSSPDDVEPLNHQEIKEVMDLCLSCKGCKTECPSGVDITKMKAEFLQQYYDRNGIPFRAKLIGNFSRQMKLASIFPWGYNFIFGNNTMRRLANKMVGFHPDRTMPLLAGTTLANWHKKRMKNDIETGRKVHFFCDEFTNYYDVEIGKKAILLLEILGYEVIIPTHVESGRTYLSKGLVKQAARIANQNINLLSESVSEEIPITGVEPSAILTLRDEYIDLAVPANKQKAVQLAKHTFTIEEFICLELEKGNINRAMFTKEKRIVAVHGHCYQKVLSSQHYSNTMLSIPENYQVQIIPSGCCGMAGAFGYEAEHYEVSQKIGELVLFPFVRNFSEETIVAASGTSCRHQIKDGTKKIALHPVEILWDALV